MGQNNFNVAWKFTWVIPIYVGYFNPSKGKTRTPWSNFPPPSPKWPDPRLIAIRSKFLYFTKFHSLQNYFKGGRRIAWFFSTSWVPINRKLETLLRLHALIASLIFILIIYQIPFQLCLFVWKIDVSFLHQTPLNAISKCLSF